MIDIFKIVSQGNGPIYIVENCLKRLNTATTQEATSKKQKSIIRRTSLKFMVQNYGTRSIPVLSVP